MKRSRMFTDDDPGAEEADTPTPRTTIVGGRPPEVQPAVTPVPTGLQSLLRLAALDPAFCEELIRQRVEAASAAGVDLTPSEQAILAAIPAEQIEQMAAQMPPPPEPRRDFLRKTAATAVVLLGGAVLSDCESCQRPGQPDGGAAPDEPPPPPRPPRPDATKGIRPDLDEPLPERPGRPIQTRGISPDRVPRKKG